MTEACTWRATPARGVYLTTCNPTGVLDVPPPQGAECPHCHTLAVMDRPSGKVATLADFRKWQAEQQAKSPESERGDHE